MTAYAGGVVEIEDLEEVVAAARIKGRAQRLSNGTTTTTTEIGVIELNDIPLKGGNAYEIKSTCINISSTVAGDDVILRYRYTTDGSTPTIASSQYIVWRGEVADATHSPIETFAVMHYPVTDETFSLWLTIQRVAGTGNVRTGAGATTPNEINIIDCGAAVADTGVDL